MVALRCINTEKMYVQVKEEAPVTHATSSAVAT